MESRKKRPVTTRRRNELATAAFLAELDPHKQVSETLRRRCAKAMGKALRAADKVTDNNGAPRFVVYPSSVGPRANITQLQFRPKVTQPPPSLRNLGGFRTRECLLVLADNPGISNQAIANALGIPAASQVSLLLSQLAKKGLLFKHAGEVGLSNAWWLTPDGEEAAQFLKYAEKFAELHSSYSHSSAF